MKLFLNAYKKLLFDYTNLVIIFFLLILVFFGYHSINFRLDASSESLTLEGDKDVEYYRFIKERYGSDDYLIVTFDPIQKDLFSKSSLRDLGYIKNKISNINNVESVTTILDAPLINSPKISFDDIPNGIKKIEDGNVDIELAKKELISSTLYKNVLISENAEITTILIKFISNKRYNSLLKEKSLLLDKKKKSNLSKIEFNKITNLSKEIISQRKIIAKQHSDIIYEVRNILSEYKNNYNIHIGGVPMIALDSINFIKNDIKIFGFAVLCFVVFILFTIFRSVSWVLPPLLVCFFVVLTMIGILGLLDWPITLLSSNFIALLLILTLSITIHVTVRVNELSRKNKNLNKKDLIFLAIKKIATPCFYTSITTIVAFLSLVLSGIKPVMDFGYIMSIGIVISFIYSFLLLPIFLIYNKSKFIKEKKSNMVDIIINYMFYLVKTKGYLLIILFITIVLLGVIGVTKISVENSFINYYKKSTDISKGMLVIDNKLGGTTPFDIIIDAPKNLNKDKYEDKFDDFDDFDDLEEANIAQDTNCSYDNGYWFTRSGITTIRKIHNYLDGLSETGKIISFNTAIDMLQSLNNDNPIDTLLLKVACRKINNDIKEILFKPYLSEDGNQIRFSIRIFESSEDLQRIKFVEKVNHDLITNFQLEKEQLNINGVLVLYNNILSSLFSSQILTIGFVFLAIFIMFIILFRNFYISVLAIIPNISVAILILGIMGLFNIALDIMTVAIASIAIGIAVDDTIHYIHRFIEELKKDKDYINAIKRTYDTAGKAMYYTTVIISFGFSILIFSNFVPTIYFGLLTALSMILALLLNFLILPLLILWFKPIKF